MMNIDFDVNPIDFDTRELDLATGYDDYFFELMGENDIEASLEIFIESFQKKEPLSMCLGLNREEFLPIARFICEQAVADRLGIILRDRCSNHIKGFSIGKPYDVENTFSLDIELSPKFLPLFAIHDELDFHLRVSGRNTQNYFLHHTLGIGEIENPDIHQRLKSDLYRLTYHLARSRGFNFAVGHATSMFTHRIYQENGFVAICQIHYKDFVFEGQKPFSSIRWHKGCSLFLKELV